MPNDNNVVNLSPKNFNLNNFFKKLTLVPVFAIFLVFAMVAGLTSFYTVDPDEDAVVLRLGKYDRTVGPGLHFKMPFNLEEVHKIPVRKILKMEFGFRTKSPGVRTTYSTRGYETESIMLTGDLNVVDISWIIQYQVKDAKNFLFNVHNVTKNLYDISASVVREVVGDHTFTETITGEREAIAVESMNRMQDIIDGYKMGVRLVALELQDIFPPEKVKPSFDEVNAAVQDAEQIANVAKRQREKLIQEEIGKAKQIENLAQAYKIDLVNHAKGDAKRFLAFYEEYKKAPKVTKQRLYFDNVKETLSKSNKLYVIDPKIKSIVPFLKLSGE